MNRKRLVKGLLEEAVNSKADPEPEVEEIIEESCCNSNQELKQLQREIVDLKHRVQVLEGELTELRKVPEMHSSKIGPIFEKVLTANQLKMILGEKKRVKWTEEEFSRAFTIRLEIVQMNI